MTKLNRWKLASVVLLLCAGMTGILQAQTFTTLVNFDITNGADPYLMSLVQGPNGNLYGTTDSGGGFAGCGPPGCGTVFEITRNGTLTQLYNFGAEGHGAYPLAGLLLAPNGKFYGTTARVGSVFEISSKGQLRTVYAFCSKPNCSDGSTPWAGLMLATDGNFYGTTAYGGSTNCAAGCGTVFKITPGGQLDTLYNFCFASNCADGYQPFAALVEGTDGNLYGTTYLGGNNSGDCFSGCGTIFKITPTGSLTTLYQFALTDGQNPDASLIQGVDGKFYGTTVKGGALGDGTVFEITSAGNLTTLYSFSGGDGMGPYAGLIQATDGNFYGTTYLGGDFSCNYDRSCGTVFKLTPAGTLTTLHVFEYADGAEPFGGLVQATDGTFYGAAYSGGNFVCDRAVDFPGCGTVYSLSVGLGPFIAFVRPYGKVGQTGGILGQGFIGTTSVSLNGIPASFTVVSDTFIKATVPVGATTGYVTVTTPSGTLTSNVPFNVLN
jgi:uncharacterized repeat protein (TIGR03803 family)